MSDAATPEPARPRRRRPGGAAAQSAAADRAPRAPKAKGRSAAALAAIILFAWAESLLLFDWLRVRVMEPAHRPVVYLTVPIFAGAVVAMLLALRARARGAKPVGGPRLDAFAVASGLLATTALVLALWLGPRLHAAEETARQLDAVRQLEDLSAAIAAYRDANGRHPDASGGAALVAALAPRFASARAPSRDPWGHELEYRSLSDGRGYLLVSAGRDGVQDLPVSDYVETPDRAGRGNDIVVINGYFFGSGIPDVDDRPRPWQSPELMPSGSPLELMPSGSPLELAPSGSPLELTPTGSTPARPGRGGE